MGCGSMVCLFLCRTLITRRQRLGKAKKCHLPPVCRSPWAVFSQEMMTENSMGKPTNLCGSDALRLGPAIYRIERNP